jgi:hypothetical protein
MSELEKLQRQNAELADRIAKLEEAAKPPKPSEPFVMPRIDYTEGMTMPRNAMEAMVDASRSYMADLRADARKPNPIQASSSPITSSPSTQSQPQKRGTGWRDEAPLGPPSGVEHCDRLVDAQDIKDRAELIERELKLAKARMGKGDVK